MLMQFLSTMGLIITAVVVVFLIGFGAFISRFYRKVEQGQALVRNG